MKKPQSTSQYRAFRQPATLSPELIEELRVLKSLEAQENKQS